MDVKKNSLFFSLMLRLCVAGFGNFTSVARQH